MLQIIDGKKISAEIKDELKAEVARLAEEGRSVCLAVIQVGNDPASTIYVNNKKKACAYIGIESLSYELPEGIEDVRTLIASFVHAEVERCNQKDTERPLLALSNAEEIEQKAGTGSLSTPSMVLFFL